MGICEYRGDKNIIYTTKSLLQRAPGTKSTNLYFSTQPLFKLDGDCLIILCKEPQNLKQNKFIKSIRHKSSGSKICKQFENACKQNKPQFGSMVLFNYYSPYLEFSKFGVLCVSELEFQQAIEGDNRRGLQDKIRNNLAALANQNVRSLAITEFQWKSLISKQQFFKIFTKIAIDSKCFKSMVFACSNQEMQSLFMKTAQQILSQT